MPLFSDIIGAGYNEEIVTLARKEKSEKAVPTTVQAPYPMEVKRVNAWDLETCYIFDPIIFNSINKNVQTIMAAGYELQCKDEKVLKYFQFQNRLQNILY